MNPFAIFWDYFETGRYTLYWLIFLAGFAVLGPALLKVRPSRLHRAALIAGVVLRIFWCGYSSHVPETTWQASSIQESDWINIHAVDLTKGIWFRGVEGEPSGRRPIGYPMALGLCYAIFGVHPWVLWGLHLVLYLAGAACLYGLSGHLLPERVRAWPSVFYALYPISIYTMALPTDEHLFLPLFFGGLWFLLRETSGERVPWSWLVYGLLFGYATMTRTHSIFMPVVVGLAMLLRRSSWKRALSMVFAVLMVMQLMNLPWLVRNTRAWGVPVLYTATSHYIYAQVNSTANAKGEGHIPLKGEEGYSEELDQAMRQGNAGRIHQISGRLMKKWILTHPLDFLWMGSGRLLIFMGWDRQGVWPIWFQYFDNAYDPARPLPHPVREGLEEAAYIAYYLLFMSCLVVLIGARYLLLPGNADRVRGWLVIGSVFIFWFLEHMIIYPDRKYRYPLEPLLMILASFLWYHMACLRERIRK